MNKVELVGRLTKDPEAKYSTGEHQTCIVRFTLAVNRRFKNSDGGYDADFINCVAFGKTGEFIEKNFLKGMAIGITGRIQTGNYTNKDGVKTYTTDIVVEEAEFVESKKSSGNTTSNNIGSKPAPAASVPDSLDDEELPFT